MKQTVYTYARNNGDGSSSIDIFFSEEERRGYILDNYEKTIEDIEDGCPYEDGYVDNTTVEFVNQNNVVEFKTFTVYSEA